MRQQSISNPISFTETDFIVAEVYEHGSWTLKLNAAGDNVEAIDDFALAEMAAQIRGYGG